MQWSAIQHSASLAPVGYPTLCYSILFREVVVLIDQNGNGVKKCQMCKLADAFINRIIVN
jgi:hypothetical protein